MAEGFVLGSQGFIKLEGNIPVRQPLQPASKRCGGKAELFGFFCSPPARLSILMTLADPASSA